MLHHPVGMDIEYAHEHRELNRRGMEIFVLESFFECDDLAVGACDDHISLFAFKEPTRGSEEVYQQKIQDTQNQG